MAGQADVNRRFYKAARSGNVETVKSLFSGSPIPDIDFVYDDIWHQTALYEASIRGHLGVVEYLIGKGADLQALSASGETAAHAVCINWSSGDGDSDDRSAILRLLIKKDRSLLDRKVVDWEGNTCLHRAARKSQTDLIKWLLDAGADAATQSQLQHTAWDILIESCSKKSPFSGKYLEQFTTAYRAFVRKEMGCGNITNALERIYSKKVGEIEFYELLNANIVDLYVLLEYLAYLTPLEQACQQIRRELCLFVETSNGWRYREPSCIFGIQTCRHHQVRDTAFEEVCDRNTYESFKALVSIADAYDRPKTTSFTVSKPIPIDDTRKSENRRSIPAIDETDSTKTKELSLDYLSVVMPFIQVIQNHELGLDRKDLDADFRYRGKHQADLQKFHSCLTLDEYCYPALSAEILARRNSDQTMARYGRDLDPAIQAEKSRFESLVGINQAWIWLSQDMLIHTTRTGTYISDALTSDRDATSSRYTLVGHLLATLVESGHLNRIFDTFQRYIGSLTEELNDYVGQSGIESLTIQKEKKFYHHIGDVREELSMIGRVLSQQEEVWQDFASNAWPEVWADCQNGRMRYLPGSRQQEKDMKDHKSLVRLIMRPRLRIQKSRQRISQLDEDAERVERSIANQLNLKQKHTSLQEAHATAVMSTAVFGFTIITIVFTPLSFVVTLFALPIDQFQNNQTPSRWTSDAGAYSVSYIAAWTVTAEIVSIAVTILAMWLALEYGLKYRLTLKLWNIMRQAHEKVRGICHRYLLPMIKRTQLLSRRLRDEESRGTSANGSEESIYVESCSMKDRDD